MDDELLGYCLNATDDEDRRRVEARLDADPDARRRLERLGAALRPLAADAANPDPPGDLLLRTLALVAQNRAPATLPLSPKVAPGQPMRRGWWRRPDVLVAAAVLLLSLGVLVPWIVRGRQEAQVVECQNNLKRFHQALVAYADQDSGNFPRVREEEPYNFAGSFVALLNDKQPADTNLAVGCPGYDHRDRTPLTSAQLRELYHTNRDSYDQAVRDLGGAYAYNLGYREKPQATLCGLHRGQNDEDALMADRPPFGGREAPTDGNSPNHGGRGQNVLYAGGNVRFLTSHTVNDDHLYLNKNREAHAGVGRADTVLGASDAVP